MYSYIINPITRADCRACNAHLRACYAAHRNVRRNDILACILAGILGAAAGWLLGYFLFEAACRGMGM